MPSPDRVMGQRTNNFLLQDDATSRTSSSRTLIFTNLLTPLPGNQFLCAVNMPPKRSVTNRPTGTARRGRSSTRGRGKGTSNEHTRVLSDITEESVTQIQVEQQAPRQQQRTASESEKRSLQADDPVAATAKRETRAQAAEMIKQDHAADEELLQTQEDQSQAPENPVAEAPQDPVSDGLPQESQASHIPDAYIPSLDLLFFVHLAELDTDADTESITLNLIELTLADSNWHAGLSGLVQPVACFLIASLLTRKQNLVEDVAASVEMFGLKYWQLVKGYKLLWEWKENMSEVVGVYAERLAELPDPGLLLGLGEYRDHEASEYEIGQDMDERSEPERWMETLEVRKLEW